MNGAPSRKLSDLVRNFWLVPSSLGKLRLHNWPRSKSSGSGPPWKVLWNLFLTHPVPGKVSIFGQTILSLLGQGTLGYKLTQVHQLRAKLTEHSNSFFPCLHAFKFTWLLSSPHKPFALINLRIYNSLSNGVLSLSKNDHHDIHVYASITQEVRAACSTNPGVACLPMCFLPLVADKQIYYIFATRSREWGRESNAHIPAASRSLVPGIPMCRMIVFWWWPRKTLAWMQNRLPGKY